MNWSLLSLGIQHAHSRGCGGVSKVRHRPARLGQCLGPGPFETGSCLGAACYIADRAPFWAWAELGPWALMGWIWPNNFPYSASEAQSNNGAQP